jgi:small subunit ribosomal protein S9
VAGGNVETSQRIVDVILGALAKAMPETEAALRDNNLMTRDARKVERKKYGQPGARARFQFSKR